jgi:hypothetical protein
MLLLFFKGGGTTAPVTQWFDYAAPFRVLSFASSVRLLNFAAYHRNPDFTAPRR